MAELSFGAKVLVQGVGGFVPHTDGHQLLVLFPDQDHAVGRGVRTFNDEEICRHYAVAQFNLRNVDDAMPDAWTSIDLSGNWVGIQSDSEVALDLPGGNVPGLPRMDDVLSAAQIGDAHASVDPLSLPGNGFSLDLLRAALYLDRGMASPADDWEGPFEFHCGTSHNDQPIGLDGRYSNVIEFELGQVNHLELVIQPFSGGEPRRVRLRPVGIEDQLDIWIRHFCDLREPDPFRSVPVPGQPDVDFALTYALSDGLPGLLDQREQRLPFPRVSKSWDGGSGVGGNPNRCMASQLKKTTFTSPF